MIMWIKVIYYFHREIETGRGEIEAQ